MSVLQDGGGGGNNGGGGNRESNPNNSLPDGRRGSTGTEYNSSAKNEYIFDILEEME